MDRQKVKIPISIITKDTQIQKSEKKIFAKSVISLGERLDS